MKKVKLDESQKINTRGNLDPIIKKPLNAYDMGFLKKEEVEQNLEELKFFPPALNNDIGSKKGSAFNRAVGFRTIPPGNDEASENRSHENIGYQTNKPASPKRINQVQ